MQIATTEAARVLWNYLRLDQKPDLSDAILVLGNHDILTAHRGVELFKLGLAPLLIFSGGLGRVTDVIWTETEARKFARIAFAAGIPATNVLIEEQSTNTAENILLVRQMLAEKSLSLNSIIAVHKPYMERRVYGAMKVYWSEVRLTVTSPALDFDEYLRAVASQGFSAKHTVEMIVGDFQRIDVYAKKGYQIHQEIPESAWKAYFELKQLGYTQYLIQERI